MSTTDENAKRRKRLEALAEENAQRLHQALLEIVYPTASKKYQSELKRIDKKLEETLAAIHPVGTDHWFVNIDRANTQALEDLVRGLNAHVRWWLEYGNLNDQFGIHTLGLGYAKETVRLIYQSQLRLPSREEELVLETSRAYLERKRLTESGSKDGRLAAAWLVSAERVGVSGENPAEAVRKSNQRLKRKLRGQKAIRLNLETFQVEIEDRAEIIFRGLPSKRGAPRCKD